MSEISDTRSVYGRTGKRKRFARRRDSDEIPFEPERKVRKRFQTVSVKRSGSRNRSSVAGRPLEESAASRSSVADCPLEGSAASSSSVEDCLPQRPAAISRSSVAGRPLEGSVAGEQEVEISDGRGDELEPAGHADDEHGSVDVSEHVAGHSSVDSDGDSVKCPVCSVTFTTQDTRHL
jgi:hypothetical protein